MLVKLSAGVNLSTFSNQVLCLKVLWGIFFVLHGFFVERELVKKLLVKILVKLIPRPLYMNQQF